MLVFLRSVSSPSTVAGRSLAREVQSDVASLVSSLGSDVIARTLVPNTLTVKLTASQAASLASSPLVAHVYRNASIPGPSRPYAERPTTGSVSSHGVQSHAVSCGTAAHPQLNPEALTNIKAPGAWAQGATGAGVKVAFLADGLDINNPDFLRNAAYGTAGQHVIVDYQDFAGDGTNAATGGAEAFGDASSIAAQGNQTYDLSTYNLAHPLPLGCDIKIVGVAPGAQVIAEKVFAQNNLTTGSGFVQAINYAVTHGAKVINESFGGQPFPDDAADITRAADDAAVAAGVTVVASSGDAGITSTIGSPATDPGVISVGASTTFRSYQQDTFGGINAPGESGGYVDNNISGLSSGGFAQNGRTVDLVAPGDLGWALCSTNTALYPECAGTSIQNFGGTSQSSPLTSGAAADVIQAYASTHSGAYPTPDLVARILTSTAQDAFAPASQQGAGLLDVAAAVAMARAYKTHVTVHPTPGVLSSIKQINLEGNPGSSVSKSFKLTNTSSKTTVVKLSTRGLVASGGTSGTVTLDPSVATTQPKFSIWSGALEVYQKISIHVPANVNRLQLQSAYQFTGQTSLLHVSLFDPHGRLAGYSLPQGLADYADVEAAQPMKGTWTAVYFTVWNGFGSGNVGTSGPVPWTATFLKFTHAGSIAAGVILKPGQTKTVKYTNHLASSPGDSDAAILVNANGSHSTIPVTLRADIVVGNTGGQFSGVLTGGNGREPTTGQMNTYDFKVPAGKTDLDASLALASNPGTTNIPADQMNSLLVDPNGQIAAYDTNYAPGNAGLTINLYAAHPVAGNWRLVIEWIQPTTGLATSIPFTGAVEFNQVSSVTTLPNSSSSTISASSGADYTIKITNNGVAPMAVSPDARLTTTTALALTDVFGDPLTQAMPSANNSFYVPTETSSFKEQVAGSLPLTFDVSTYTGDPDISPSTSEAFSSGSVSPTLAQLTYAPPSGVSSGLWYSAPAEFGPYGTGNEPSGTETTTFTAHTLGFDPTVTSAVPDSVAGLTFGSTINPDFVLPGTSDTITVHIAPTGAVGSVQQGTLFIDGLTLGTEFGISTIGFTSIFTADIAAIPYKYKVAS